MTRELYDISMKYQRRFNQLLELNVKEFDAFKIILEDWKKEKLKEPLGYFRTSTSVNFMLKIQPWYYKNKKTGRLLSDSDIRSKHFLIS